MGFQKFFSRLLLRFGSPEIESSYKQFQADNDKKLEDFIYYFMMMILPIICISSILRGMTFEQSATRLAVLFLFCLLSIVRKKSPYTYSVCFLTLFWAMSCYYSSATTMTYFADNDKLGPHFLGYLIGVIEAMIAFSVTDLYLRVAFQLALIFARAIALSQYFAANPALMVYLCFLSLITTAFFLSHNYLNRKSFKMIHESREKLQRFQTLITDDFPLNVLIMSSNMNSVIYSNKCFSQNFINLDGSVDAAKDISGLFAQIILEADQVTGLSSQSGPVSLFKFITESTEAQSKFHNKEVINLFTTYQVGDQPKCQYEIKLRKILWEDQSAFTILLNDVSYKQQMSMLQLADEHKDRVIATVSHELRTPINGILAFLEIIISQVTDQVCLTYLDHCKSCSKLLLYLVNSILDLSQIRHNSLKIAKDTFNFCKFLEEVRSLYIFTSQHRGIDFIIEKSAEVPENIFTDQYRLIEILINLLGNAMKFTFTGYVKLKVSLDDKNSSKLLFCIEDTGIGIKDKDKSKLFKMFGKLPQSNSNINTHGVGLGLTIANELVKALNNNDESEFINFDTKFGSGSKFWFCVNYLTESEASPNSVSKKDCSEENLPISRFESVIINNAHLQKLQRGILDHRSEGNVSLYNTFACLYSSNVQRPEIRSSQKRVLIVDDNPFNIVAASFIVKKFGLIATNASSGEECIKCLEESYKQNEYFDLILMDIQMPIMDGIEATTIIKSRIGKNEMYDVPIIALTAHKIGEKERKKYKDIGMVEALEKPLLQDEMRIALNKLPNFSNL